MKTKRLLCATLLLANFHLPLFTAHAQGTGFSCQGRLNNGASPANGSFDLTFAVFRASNGVGQVGGTLTNSATAVGNGLFTVTLDFGPDIFSDGERWLEIGVRTNGGGAFSTLAGRQPITPSPYAIYAGGAQTASTAASTRRRWPSERSAAVPSPMTRFSPPTLVRLCCTAPSGGPEGTPAQRPA